MSHPCACTCHTEGFERCDDCAHLHDGALPPPAEGRFARGGDNDMPYTFGRALDLYIAPIHHAGLVALRGLVKDARAGAPADPKFRLSARLDLQAEDAA